MFTMSKNHTFASTVAAGLIATLATSSVFAQGGTDIDCVFDHGTGTITDVTGGTLIEVDTTTAILTCTNFDVFTGGFVDFVQQNATDRVLAQVTGGASDINGDLTANGIVYIANPNGIFFGSEAVVNAGGLFAVSGSIVDTDFINGVNRFSTAVVNGNGAGEVRVNAGANITADAVHLIGRIVENAGSIDVGNGVVTMVSGPVVTITESGPGNRVTVAIDTSSLPAVGDQLGVEHTDDGSIDADGGQVILGAGDLYSLAIESAGPINADNGSVEFSALEGSVTHSNQGGSISAENGDVTMISNGGDVVNLAPIDAANGTVTLTATDGNVGNVGNINAAGGDVMIDASVSVLQLGNTTGGDVTITAADDVILTDTSITATDGEILLHAGTDGTGDLEFGLAGQNNNIGLSAETITLRAGDGGGGAGTGSLIDFDAPGLGDTNVSFFDAASQNSPGSFTLRQDAAITDSNLPIEGNFGDGDGVAGMDYTIQSDDNSVAINDATNLTGSNLTVLAGTDFDLDTSITLGSLTATADTLGGGGTITIDAANVTTTGSQTYNSATGIAQDVTLTGADIAFNSTLDSQIANFDLVVNDSGNTVFGDTVGGSLALGSITTNVGGSTEFAGNTINTTGDQTYNDSLLIREDTTINAVNATFEQINSATTTHRSLTINASGITQFNAAIGTLEALFALTTDAAGTTQMDAGQVVTLGSGDQVYSDPFLLQSDTTLTAENVTFNNTVDSESVGNFSLTVNASDATVFNDVVGGNQPLSSLVTDAPGTLALNGGEVRTTMGQSYSDAATLDVSTNLFGSGIAFNGTLDGATAGGQNLLVQGPNGGTDSALFINGEIGGNVPLGTLTVRGLTFFDDSVTTTGTQRYVLDASTFDPDVTLTAPLVQFLDDIGADGGSLNIVGNAEFGDAADDGDVIDGLGSLMVSGTSLMNLDSVTTSGNQTYGGDVTLVRDGAFTGNTIIFNEDVLAGGFNIDIIGGAVLGDATDDRIVDLNNLTITGPGQTFISSNQVTATGNQSYGNAVFLREDTTITANDVSFFATVDSATTTHRTLTVNADGQTFFGDEIGSIEALFALITDAPGTTVIDAGNISAMGSGDIIFNDPVFLQSDTTLNAENVTFNSTVDTGDADPVTLTINASDATTFNDFIGATSPLGELFTDAPGTLAVNTSDIMTTGNQTYNDAMTIGNDVTFSGNNVIFGETVDGTTAGSESIIVQGPTGGNNGNATVLGEVGGNVALDTFTVRGTATLAGDVTTTNEQDYEGNVTVVGDSNLDASLVRFDEDVIGGNPPNNGDLNIVNDVEFGDAADDGDVVAGFDNLTVGGNALMNVDSVTTNQTQNYNGDVTLVRDGQFTGTTVAFNEDLLAGGFDVTITGGAVLGNAADDRVINVNNLLINGTGNTFISSSELSAAGDQTYGNALFLREDTTMTANNVSFLSTVDSATADHKSLIVNATGLTLFDGIVGGLEPLFALTTDAPGNTRISTSAMTAMGSGDFVFNDPVLLDQDTTLTAENVTFNSTLDSFSATNPAGLTIDSTITTTFNDQVGSFSPLAFLTTNAAGGTTFMNGGTIETVLDQTYNDPITLQQNTTLITSSDGDITFNNTIDGTTVGGQSLTLDGNVFFNDTVGGNVALASVLANDFAFLNGDVTTTGTQVYRGDVSVGDSSTLDASLVQFEESINSNGGNLNIINNVEFGDVTDDGDIVTGLDTLTLGGTTLVNADSITTNDTQTYNGDVTLTTDGQFTGSTVSFNEDVLANGNSIAVNGNATLGDAADDRIQDLNNLLITGTANINASSIQSTGNQDYNGNVNIGNDLTIDSNRVTFAQQINGDGNDLTVNALDTFFNGNVINIDNLITDAAGTTRISNDITVINSMNFGDVVVLTGDATLTQNGDAAGGITFQQDLRGTQALIVRSNGNARFGGDIGGGESPLSSFETLVNGTLIFDGNFITVVNDILFNANLNRVAVPARATVGANGNLTITSTAGNFTMGQNEKMTVLGDLNVNADTATLGDINTLGDMRINANAILLLTREPGLIDDADGGTFLDSGLDYVAGGQFFFSVTPILIGENPVGFANTDGDGDALGTLANFDIGAFGPVTPAQLGDGDDGFFDLASRDLISAINIGIVYPGTPGLLLDEVPPESELEEVEQDTPIRPSELDELGRNLSIFGRLLSPAELAELTLGRSLYIDPPSTVLDMGRMRSEIVIQRMLYGSIRDALDEYQQLIGRGDRPITQIRDEMNDAYILYLTDLDEDAEESAADFATTLQKDHPELANDIAVVNTLLTKIRIIGQTPAEVTEAETQLIEKITPREMDPDMMRDVIEVMDEDGADIGGAGRRVDEETVPPVQNTDITELDAEELP